MEEALDLSFDRLLMMMTCFGRLSAHHQEKKLCLCPKYVEIDTLKVNILRINCAPNWFYLQDYTGMHGQQNILKNSTLCPQRIFMITVGISETTVTFGLNSIN